MKNRLHIAIPLLKELDNLPELISNISKQDYTNYVVYFCINQPDDWWSIPEKLEDCNNNQESINYIESNAKFQFEIIDKSSPGKGWIGKKLGVGWARKVILDRILEEAEPSDIFISLDADTIFNSNYFSSVNYAVSKHIKAPAIGIPYYHPLSGQELEDRAILHYEIYMRYYLINLYRIHSPYAFSALGSAIVAPIWAIKKIGGMTPKKSGEDFYFLQKMVKFRPILNWCNEKVYPAARFSDRVFFGTGPAMIKGASGDWNSYPIYPYKLFDEIKSFYDCIPDLFTDDCKTTIDSVFTSENDSWESLRKNNKDLKHFTKAVHDKFDGLRILQFLKLSHSKSPTNDEESLINFINHFHPNDSSQLFNEKLSFEKSSIGKLNEIRDYLCNLEDNYRLSEYEQYGT